jgi:putative transposase
VRVFTRFDHDRYWHHAWVVMPNHTQLLVTLKKGVVLSNQINAWKGVSSREIGKLMGRRMSDEAF